MLRPYFKVFFCLVWFSWAVEVEGSKLPAEVLGESVRVRR